jgi:glycosyltransferase involved in cell wall biosynthesis
MKIYIDGLFYKGSGIGRYYESLLKELSKRNFEIYTCVPKILQKDFLKDFEKENIKPIFVDYMKFSIKGFISQSKILKSLEDKVDLFFFCHVNLPLYVPKKTIVTIHDIIPLKEEHNRNIFKRFIFYFFLRRALKKSEKIITVSRTTANEIKKMFPKYEKEFNVIYRFVDDKFLNTKNIKKNNIINKPYILFVGNRKRHKNIGLLLKAFYLIKEKLPHYLVIAGSKDENVDYVDKMIKELKLENRVIQLIKPDDEEIVNLYYFADLFVFPSFIEGFGLPAIEAISLGCPVLLSNIEVFNELFGDSAIYFDPYDEQDLANKIVHLLTDKEAKNSLLDKQRERIKIFDKEKIIDEHIKLFKEVVKS